MPLTPKEIAAQENYADLARNVEFMEALRQLIRQAPPAERYHGALAFFRRVVELQQGNPDDCDKVAYAIAYFYTRHRNATPGLENFMRNCNDAEREALKEMLADKNAALKESINAQPGRRKRMQSAIILASPVWTVNPVAGALVTLSMLITQATARANHEEHLAHHMHSPEMGELLHSLLTHTNTVLEAASDARYAASTRAL